MKVLTDYEGRAVRLTDERLAHILEHPEMVGMEDKIEETLATPERVIESQAIPRRAYTIGSMWGPEWATNTFASSSSWRRMMPSF